MAVNRENLLELLDGLLFFGMNEKYKTEIELASKMFTKAEVSDIQLSSDAGFTDWYIHNYQFQNKMYLTDLFRKSKEWTLEEKDILDRIENSFISVFEVQGSGDNVYFKDIFNRTDYGILDKEEVKNINENELYFVRLYPGEGGFHVSNDMISLGQIYKDVLVKNFMETYNEYCRLHGALELDAYTYGNPLIMYKIVHILEDLDAETTFTEGDYSVYQSVYVYKNIKPLLELLDNDKRFEKALHEFDSYVYKLYDGLDSEIILSEIVLCDNRLEAECLSARERTLSKKIIEEVLSDQIVFLEDSIVDFDDLL